MLENGKSQTYDSGSLELVSVGTGEESFSISDCFMIFS